MRNRCKHGIGGGSDCAVLPTVEDCDGIYGTSARRVQCERSAIKSGCRVWRCAVEGIIDGSVFVAVGDGDGDACGFGARSWCDSRSGQLSGCLEHHLSTQGVAGQRDDACGRF